MTYWKIIFLFLGFTTILDAAEPSFNLQKFEVSYSDSLAHHFYTFPSNNEIRPNITLVLSGGGARGLSQIGVLNFFEKKKINISNIVGTSIGAFLGGLYASGYSSEQLMTIIDTTSWDELLSINDTKRSEYFLDQKEVNDRSFLRLRFRNFKFIFPEALSYGNRFSDYLNILFWNSIYHSDDDFDKLKYNFRATATDIVLGKPIVFHNGNLIKTVRASGNLPLRNSPVQIDSTLLIDGGIFQNIPLEAAKEFNSDLIILINTVSPLLGLTDLNRPWNVADQVVSIMMKKFEDDEVKKADIEIKPNLDSINNTEFDKGTDLIKIGYNSTLNTFDKITKKMDSLELIKIRKYYHAGKITNIDIKEINVDTSLSISIQQELNNIIKSSTWDDTEKFRRIIKSSEGNDYWKLYLENGKNGQIIIKGEQYPSLNIIEIDCESFELHPLNDAINNEFGGKRLNTVTFNKICEEVIGYLRKLNYPFAEIINANFNNGKLLLKLTLGRADKFNVKSKLSTNDFLIMRELKLKKHLPLKIDDIRNSWENIVSSDLFSDVNFEFMRDKKDTAYDLNIYLREKGNQMLSFGANIDNERYLQAGLDFIHNNFFNTATNIAFRAVAGPRNYFFNLSISQQRFLSSMVTAQVSGYYKYIKRWTFEGDILVPENRFKSIIQNEEIDEAYGIKGSAGFQLAKLGNINIEYRYERQRNFFRDTIQRRPFITINSVSVGTIYDNRDKIHFAKRGRYINLSLETSLFKSTDEPRFSRVTFIQENNFNIRAFTFRPRIIFGLADKSLPFNEFYRLGGERTFYGYREDEIYGRQAIAASLESEIKMPFTLLFDTYLAFRYDIGSAWLTPETIKIADLKHGVGMSIALDTPIGPVRLSAGEAFFFVTNPNGARFGYPHVYFSIGVRL